MANKKQPTTSMDNKDESLSKYLKGITNQILQIRPQTELAELKARFAKANYENVLYTLQLDSLMRPSQENTSENEVTEEVPEKEQAVVKEMTKEPKNDSSEQIN